MSRPFLVCRAPVVYGLAYGVVHGLALAGIFLGAGCGLTLDYDPPEDGGLDGTSTLDVPCGGCAAGLVCLEGTCFTPCGAGGACHGDDATCETCDTARGVCVASDVTCGGGCNETCNPVSDVCEPNCGVGTSCLGGMCSAQVPCTLPGGAECQALSPNECGDHPTCGLDGFCADVVVPRCLAYECAVGDPCNGCALSVQPERCTDGTRPICDVAGERYRCVACVDDTSCGGTTPICDVALGTCRGCSNDSECGGDAAPHCNVGTGACVPCLVNEHCVDSGNPVCDVATNQCVECLTAAECDGGQVCRPDHRCGACTNSAECGRFAVCEMGACVGRPCADDGECPAVSCARPGTCMGGRCAYDPRDVVGLCGDTAICTTDVCAPLDPRADALGCVHQRGGGFCDDEIDCTVDLCVGGAIVGDGCAHRPSPRVCGSPGECSRWLCVARRAGGGFAGCAQQFTPRSCGAGSLCGRDGDCAPADPCSGSCDDGFACNGVEACVGGTCMQGFSPTSTCGACDAYCASETSCEHLPGVPAICP